jgi:hypothetical protein
MFSAPRRKTESHTVPVPGDGEAPSEPGRQVFHQSETKTLVPEFRSFRDTRAIVRDEDDKLVTFAFKTYVDQDRRIFRGVLHGI